jgi:hypothetical protein
MHANLQARTKPSEEEARQGNGSSSDEANNGVPCDEVSWAFRRRCRLVCRVEREGTTQSKALYSMRLALMPPTKAAVCDEHGGSVDG